MGVVATNARGIPSAVMPPGYPGGGLYILAGAPVPVCKYNPERQRTVVTPNDGLPAFFPSRLMAYRLTVHGVARVLLLPRFRGWGPIRSHPTLTSLK